METLTKITGWDAEEAKIYMACLKSGPLSVTEVSKSTGIKRTTLYPIIHTLEQQGYLHTVQRGKRTLYDATSPQIFEKTLTDKLTLTRDLLPQLEHARSSVFSLPHIRILDSEESVIDEYEKIYARVQNDEHACFLTSVADLERYWPEGLDRYIEAVGCSPQKNIRELIRWDTAGLRYSREMRQRGHKQPLRLIPREYNIYNDLVLFEDSVMFLTFQKRLSAVVIHDARVHKTVQTLFDFLWEGSTPR